MKKMIVLASFFLLNAAQADVFKCVDATGKTVYQETPCKTGTAEKVDIKASDPNKISEAQTKLTEQLKQTTERENAEAEAAQKERELEAREAMTAEAINRTEAINRNTQAIENITQTPAPSVDYEAPAPAASPNGSEPVQQSDTTDSDQ